MKIRDRIGLWLVILGARVMGWEFCVPTWNTEHVQYIIVGEGDTLDRLVEAIEKEES